MRQVCLCVLAAGIVLAGCGSSAPAPLAPGDSARLRRDIGAVRSAAAASDPAAAHAALARLRADITQLLARNRISRPDGQVLLVASGQADGRVTVEARAPTQPAAAATTAATGTPPPATSAATATPPPAATTTSPTPTLPFPFVFGHGHNHDGGGNGGNQGGGDGGD